MSQHATDTRESRKSNSISATMVAAVITAMATILAPLIAGYFFPPAGSEKDSNRNIVVIYAAGWGVLADAVRKDAPQALGVADGGSVTTAKIGSAVRLSCGVTAAVQSYREEHRDSKVIVDGRSRGFEQGGETYKITKPDGAICTVSFLGLQSGETPNDRQFAFRCDC